MAYSNGQQAAGELADLPVFAIPWFHNVLLLTRLKDNTQRLWYAKKILTHGWSRNILEMQIDGDIYAREGKAITNFEGTLPKPHSDLAQQMTKDPYALDFLMLSNEALEREVEKAMMENIQKVLLELGAGFSFVGRQVPVEVGGETYFLDLLFYHLKLRCFVVVELLCCAQHKS